MIDALSANLVLRQQQFQVDRLHHPVHHSEQVISGLQIDVIFSNKRIYYVHQARIH